MNNLETELKFNILDNENPYKTKNSEESNLNFEEKLIDFFKTVGRIQNTTPKIKILKSQYLDTKDYALEKNFVVLRIREKIDKQEIDLTGKEKEMELTVKTLCPQKNLKDGMHIRRELNFRIDEKTLKDKKLFSRYLQEVLSKDIFCLIKDGKLKSRMEVVMERKLWIWEYEKSILEISRDTGYVQVAEMKDDFDELEIEINDNDIKKLHKINHMITEENFGLKPSNVSKYERGLNLSKRDSYK